jgi:uncharacterized protein involved in exopolysaccharide biosynthesis
MTVSAAPKRSPHADIASDAVGEGAAREFWSFFTSLSLPLRFHAFWIAGLGVTAALAVLALSFAIKVEFSSTVSFFVDRSSRSLSLPSGLAALGKQLGLGDLDTGQPLDFYAWLSTSDDVLQVILLDTLPPALRSPLPTGQPTTVWERLYGHANAQDTTALTKAVEKLRRDVRSRVDYVRSLVSIEIRAPNRELAMYLGRRVFEQINWVNTHTRQTRAGNELRFLQAQQQSAADSLRAAEEALSSFYQRNRQYQNSPNLVFEQERLKRAADLAQEVYLGLTRSAQDAELRSVGDLPALTLIEGPTYPLRPAKPKRLLLTLLGAIVGIVIGYSYVSFRMLGATSAP